MPAHRRKSGHEDAAEKGMSPFLGRAKGSGKGKSAGKKRKYVSSQQSDSNDDSISVRVSTGGKFADIVVMNSNSQDKHKPAELFKKDLISAMKMPDSEPLLIEEYILIGDPWRQDWEKGVQVPVNRDASKQFKAEAAQLEPSSCSGFFKLGEKYITTHEYKDASKRADNVCRCSRTEYLNTLAEEHLTTWRDN